jgi:hypothetical protein
MTPTQALEVLRESIDVSRTESNRNLSYDQVQVRDAFRVLQSMVDGMKWLENGERQALVRQEKGI